MPNKIKTKNPLPANWDAGFRKGRFSIACGGKEEPVWDPIVGWTLRVIDHMHDNEKLVYVYKTDIFLPDRD
jgi:hypothetical protein